MEAARLSDCCTADFDLLLSNPGVIAGTGPYYGQWLDQSGMEEERRRRLPPHRRRLSSAACAAQTVALSERR